MLVSILLLGGTGARVGTQVKSLLDHIRASKITSSVDELDRRFGPTYGWLYGTGLREREGAVELDTGVSFVLLDVNSGEKDEWLPIFGRHRFQNPVGPLVQGYDGNWERAYKEIKEHQQQLAKLASGQGQPATPPIEDLGAPEEYMAGRSQKEKQELDTSQIPLVTYLKNWARLADTHLVYPIFAFDGGTGRGVFEYILEHRGDIFQPKAQIIPIVITPLYSNAAKPDRRQSMLDYLDQLEMRLANGDFAGIIFLNYTMALAHCAADYSIKEPQKQRQAMRRLGTALETEEKVAFNAGFLDLGELPPGAVGVGKEQELLDKNIALAILPLMCNALGREGVPRQLQLKYPKSWDSDDIKGCFQGMFAVPCYRPEAMKREALDRLAKDDFGEFYSGFGVTPNFMTLMLHRAVIDHSFMPLYWHIAKLKKEHLKNVAFFVLSSEAINTPEADRNVQFFTTGVGARADPFIIDLEGTGNPLRGFIASPAESGDFWHHCWLYLGFQSPEIIRKGLSLLGTA